MKENEEEVTSNEQAETESSFHVLDILDTPVSRLDDVLIEKLERAFHRETSQLLVQDVALVAKEHDPIDLAYAVTKLPLAARIIVYENLPDLTAKAIFMVNTTRNTRTAIFRQLNDSEISALFKEMPSDEAVSLFDDMSDRRLKRVLELLDSDKRARISEMLKHGRHTAGRLMTDEFFAFTVDSTIDEVTAYIRNHPGIDLSNGIFVLTHEKELTGFVPIKNLIVSPPYLTLKQVMRPVLHQIHPEATRDEVVDVVERYSIPTLPVVDDEGKMVGVIVYEDVVEAMEDIADQTIASIAGTVEDFSEHDPVFRRFLLRAPFLVVTLCAGIVTSTTMSLFGGENWFVFVPFFVPLIAGMSGNVGLQCSTILVRGIATGEISSGSRKEVMLNEIGIGLLIASSFGLGCGLLVYFLNVLGIQHIEANPLSLSILVCTGLFAACMTATILGTVSPFFFARLGMDPAVASGPIVTAFNDISSTVMLIVAAWLVYFFLGL